jgi:hypothetical protein
MRFRRYERELVQLSTLERAKRSAGGMLLLAISALGLVGVFHPNKYIANEGSATVLFWVAASSLWGAFLIYRGLLGTKRGELTKAGLLARAEDEQRKAAALARRPIEESDLMEGIVFGALEISRFLLVAAAIIGFGAMLISWLKLGEWPDWSPLALGYSPAFTKYIGLNKILSWVYGLQWPFLSLVAGVAGYAFLPSRARAII